MATNGTVPQSSAPQHMLAAELRAIAETLRDAIDNIIEANAQDDSVFKYEAFGEALRIVRSARICLNGEADKLEAVQS